VAESDMSTLEERIAAALTDTVASCDLSALISEVGEAIAAADATAERERVRALDPIASPAVKARAAMEDAAFTRDRLRTALPRLQARLKVMEAAEYLARWEPEYERVKAVRDALAAEMREVYPPVVAQLADLFQRTAQCDRECSRINGSATDNEHRRLLRVDLTARGVKSLLQPDVWIAEMLRLPFFWRDSGPIYAWPPPTPPVFASGVVLPGPGPDWQTEIKARAVKEREESERVIAYYQERNRERRERELKEGKEAIAREIAERNCKIARNTDPLRGDIASNSDPF
jgi:hypothetical protein